MPFCQVMAILVCAFEYNPPSCSAVFCQVVTCMTNLIDMFLTSRAVTKAAQEHSYCKL